MCTGNMLYIIMYHILLHFSLLSHQYELSPEKSSIHQPAFFQHAKSLLSYGTGHGMVLVKVGFAPSLVVVLCMG